MCESSRTPEPDQRGNGEENDPRQVTSSRADEGHDAAQATRCRNDGGDVPSALAAGRRKDNQDRGEAEGQNRRQVPGESQRVFRECVTAEQGRQVVSTEQADENVALTQVRMRHAEEAQQGRGEQ